MKDEWPSVPEETILMLKRRRNTSALEQWTASKDGNALTVHRFWMDNGQPWQEIRAGTGFMDLAEALERIPELRTLGRGTISEYTVVTAVMDPPVLISMLEASEEGGAEAVGDWPEEVARAWAESDSLLREWQVELDWVPRWARVNDVRVSVINIGTADSPVLQPVLANEDDEQLVPIREIARSSWASESGGASISWSGGNILSLLAPGLGYSYPWDDAALDQAGIYPFTDLPEAPEELGEALADWVIETDSEVAAALELEPLDPSGVIEDAERRAWIRRLDQVTVSLEIDVKAEAQEALRERLARKSELYRRTRDGLASPRSPEGQALAAALDGALDDGNIGQLTSGHWE